MDTRAEMAQVDAIASFVASHPNMGKAVIKHINDQLAAEQTKVDIADTAAWAARRMGHAVDVSPVPTPAESFETADARERASRSVHLAALEPLTPRADATDKTDNPAKRYGVTTGYEMSVSRLSTGLSNHEVSVLVPAGVGDKGQSGTVWGVINEMTFAPSFKAFAMTVLNRAACRKGRPMPDFGTLEDVMSSARVFAYEGLFAGSYTRKRVFTPGLLQNEGIYPVYSGMTELSDSTVSAARAAGRAARQAARRQGRQAGRPTRAARKAYRAGRQAARQAWQAARPGSVAALKPRAARRARLDRQAARQTRAAREQWESKRTFATYAVNGIIGWYVNRIARCGTCEACETNMDKGLSRYFVGTCEAPMDTWDYVTVGQQIMRGLHKAAEQALTGEKWKSQAIEAQRVADAEIYESAVLTDSPVGDLVAMVAQVCGIMNRPVVASHGMSQEAANVLAVAFGLETNQNGRKVAIARLKGMASVSS